MDKNNDVVLNYDTLKVKPSIVSQKNKLKYTKMHRLLFKLESWITMRNILISSILLVFFILYILPTLKYFVMVHDRHYFGYFQEIEP